MKTKKCYYWVDLMPNWDKQFGTVPCPTPFLSSDAPRCELMEGYKRVKVCVELPVFGEETDLTYATSEEVKGGFIQKEDKE